jgi:UDP-N-acetyl-L-fucosamine synthase
MKDKFKKIRIVTVVGTRPEIIRLSRVIDKLENSDLIHHYLVHTGQNYDYELNEIFFNELEIKKPDYFLEAAGENATTTAGKILIKIDSVLKKIQPDAFLVLGDTNSCLCAIAAKKMKIPIFHMEAGNRSFDERVPEETNRKIVDHISDINLTYSDISREYLLREGINPDRIIKTGSPMLEVLNFNESKIQKSQILNKLNLVSNKYFLVSAHREENINSSNFKYLIGSLNLICKIYDFPIIISTHPRTNKKINESGLKLDSRIRLLKPLGFHDYNFLQINAKVVLSDSGTISEESSIMNFPALNIREAHERPEAMEESSVMMVGLNKHRIIQGIELLNKQKRNDERTLFRVKDYSYSNVSEKVIRIIISYVDYVNRNVWKKIGY